MFLKYCDQLKQGLGDARWNWGALLEGDDFGEILGLGLRLWLGFWLGLLAGVLLLARKTLKRLLWRQRLFARGRNGRDKLSKSGTDSW